MPYTTVDLFRAEFFKALAHPVRIRILRLLRSGEKSVTELQETVGLESSAVSQQLSILRAKNLVVVRKDGTKAFYTARDPQIFQLLDSVKEIFNRNLIDNRAMLDELEQEEKTLSESNRL
ncbi:ArsR/SmtB family transcription factor [Chloroflexota bacterium]